MNSRSFDELHTRVERLERGGRRADRALAAALIAVALAAAVGAVRKNDPPKAIEAAGFELQDKGGQAKARLGLIFDDKPWLTFLGSKGDDRLELLLFQEYTPIVSLKNKIGKYDIFMIINGEGFPALCFNDKDGIRMHAAVGGDGDPDLSLNAQGGGRMRLTSYQEHNGWTAYDRNLAMRLLMFSDNSGGTSSLSLSDRNGATRAVWAVDEDDSPDLSIRDQNGIPLFQVPNRPARKKQPDVLGAR